MNGGTCESGACTCTWEFTGALCSSVDCSWNNPCLNGGSCVNGYGACTCASGYTGALCSIVYCAGDNPCMNGGTCESSVCTCAWGYTGALCGETSKVL
eukprot:XP_011674068.1 PREDICTED: fibropellin-1-like [Strongylocentrotus purpuratus]